MVSFYPLQAGVEAMNYESRGGGWKAEGSVQNLSIPEAPQACRGRRGDPGSRGWEVG